MTPVIINLILVILGFGLLIFVHELGHFLAAKWAGIRTEAFAVGMGPVIVAWRRGVGFAPGSTHKRVHERTGKAPEHLTDEELVQHRIGETEYSLRWLPIGGFVRMLGQDDLNPAETSEHQRSYNRCPIGRRMIVVSAGVIMNLILAAVLFMIAFMIGVRFEAPVIGDVGREMPAGRAMPLNAEDLGIDTPGLEPGDRVLVVNDREARTFADLHIAAAMSRRNTPVELSVQRRGYEQPLRFSIIPERDPVQGLFAIGVVPASSTHLLGRDRDGTIQRLLERANLAGAGVEPGMAMIAADGEPVETFQQFQRIVDGSDGQPVRTIWSEVDRRGEPVSAPPSPGDRGSTVTALIAPRPEFAALVYADLPPGAVQNYETGLFGLTPLPRIDHVPHDSPNAGILKPGDVVLSVGGTGYPRMADFRQVLHEAPRGPIAMRVLRDGEELDLEATVVRRGVRDRSGMLNILPGYAWDVPLAAAPIETIRELTPERARRSTPVAGLDIPAGARIEVVALSTSPAGDPGVGEMDGAPDDSMGRTVDDWRSLREAMRNETAEAFDRGEGARLNLRFTPPGTGAEPREVELALTAEDVRELHGLGWQTDLSMLIFDRLYTRLSADGNPGTAIVMGLDETRKFLALTYLTIDRLIRRTVGIEQLRGPVGIVHIGTTIADRGILYLVFLLALISVNLAVINFLPLPIVDGGLFLFLVYEKITGRPPPAWFHNIVTIIGLALIATLFIVVTYHDILRLFE